MSSLQDKINNARLHNDQTANDAIEDIDKQTQGLITNFDRLTIDRPSKESRREAALKVLERVRNGEIEKVDEDEIKITHDEIKDRYVDPVQLDHSSDFYVDAQENNESVKTQYHENEDKSSNLSQDTSNALKRLQAMSELLNDDDINNKIQTDQKSQSIQSSFNNKSEIEDSKTEDQDKKEESLHEVKDDTKTETKHKKQGLFKKMINFFKGE